MKIHICQTVCSVAHIINSQYSYPNKIGSSFLDVNIHLIERQTQIGAHSMSAQSQLCKDKTKTGQRALRAHSMDGMSNAMQPCCHQPRSNSSHAAPLCLKAAAAKP